MQLTKGVYGEVSVDGVLHGRVGVRRWLLQCFAIGLFLLADVVTVLACLFNLKLVPLVVIAGASLVIFASCKICGYAWAWLGFDTTAPVIFDLKPSSLEVRWSTKGIFRQREWAVDTLKDVRVYWAPLDFEDMSGEGAKPMQGLQVVQKKLPIGADVGWECINACWGCCLSSRKHERELALVYLGAAVRGERHIIRLSRNVWAVKEVEGLLELARAARQQVGLQHDLPAAAVVGATSEDAAQKAPAPSALKGAAKPKEEGDLEAPPAGTHAAAYKDIVFDLHESSGSPAARAPLGAPPPAHSSDRPAPSGPPSARAPFGAPPAQPSAASRYEREDSDGSDLDEHPGLRKEATQSSAGSAVIQKRSWPRQAEQQETAALFESPAAAPAALAEAPGGGGGIRVEQMESHVHPMPRAKMKSKPKA